MSDLTAEIVEISDTSIKTNTTEIATEENNKRKLSIDNEDDLEESMSGKKLCRDTESFDDSLIVEPTLTESINVEESQIINEEESDVLENNISESKINDETSNLENDSSSLLEEQKIDEESRDKEEGSNYESSDEDDYDDGLIMRAMNALPKQPSNAPKILDDQEPIALDSDSSEDESESIEDVKENEIEDEIEGEDSFMSLQKRMMRYNPKFYFARRLIKKSIKILVHRTNAKDTKQNDFELKSDERRINENIPANENLDVQQKTSESNEEKVETSDKKQDSKPEKEINTLEQIERMDTTAVENESKEVLVNQNENNKDHAVVDMPVTVENINQDDENERDDDCNKLDDSNESEIHSLMNEISCCTVDEIMSRYVFCNTDQNNTMDEFSEQLFYCLQENKKEIENIQRVWNEKVHLKFKMREIMERVRRHRVISEIETFGIKPSQETQPCNLLLSSKSSTTNSENEHYIRSSKMSSQSVNRLIQDVRENVLKKEKHKIDDSSTPGMKLKYDENYDECSSFGLSSSMFQSSSQGRQGQTIDVQSIINDFRQKNPQEIPRRGRRMKNSFPNNYLIANHLQAQQLVSKGDEKSNNSVLDHSNTMKSNASGSFPEVSLLPVNSFYKSHSPQFGQKSSLLQSILTKQPNKHSSAMQQNNKSSTLARLLTAPEKSFQSPSRSILQQSSKVHNNGEITITPIAGTSRRQLIDDEENSEPPLVIDESDDFMSERHNASASDLLCQGCRRNKALFMCAGCSRQWYCSKECQELAWDDHAESCMV